MIVLTDSRNSKLGGPGRGKATTSVGDIRRVDFGYFVRPAEETGTGQPRVEPCLGYVLKLDAALLLFDSGMGNGKPEIESHYRPSRRSLHVALAQIGATEQDIKWVVNCHLHFDHCGGNPQLAGRPVFAQTSEMALARGEDYTLSHLIDFPGALYQEIDGEAEILPGVWVIPTPGHTEGHQSLAIRCTDGTVVLAGQAVDAAIDYTSGHLAWRARNDGAPEPLPVYRGWIERLQQFDPARVLFAHDNAVWEPA